MSGPIHVYLINIRAGFSLGLIGSSLVKSKVYFVVKTVTKYIGPLPPTIYCGIAHD